jgi:hypothetical protein
VIDRIVPQAIQHVLAVLRHDLPEDVRALTGTGDFVPGLLGYLPFISVSAEAMPARTAPLGHTMSLKREMINGAPVDLGYVTGGAGECRITLSLWAVTRPQLQRVRQAVQEITWTHRPYTWEAPSGVLNRTMLLRSQLDSISSCMVAELPPAPPHFTVTASNTRLHTRPDSSSDELGRVDQGTQFELLGRDADGNWVQGCCYQGQTVWVDVQKVETSVPLAVVPEVEEVESVPPEEMTATAAPTPGTTVWRQDLQLVAYLQATQEPIEAAGELIEEVRITRELDAGGETPDVERTRLWADREEVVEEFPIE